MLESYKYILGTCIFYQSLFVFVSCEEGRNQRVHLDGWPNNGYNLDAEHTDLIVCFTAPLEGKEIYTTERLLLDLEADICKKIDKAIITKQLITADIRYEEKDEIIILVVQYVDQSLVDILSESHYLPRYETFTIKDEEKFYFNASLICDANYYGQTCTKHCYSNDPLMKCNSTGDLVCIDQDVCEYLYEVKPCLSYPCLNGAECRNHNGSYACECPDEYKGENCEKLRCGDIDCGDHGTCHFVNQSFPFCHCDAIYYGERCEIKKNLCDEQHIKCRNGGKCVMSFSDSTSICDCPPGFGGIFCQDPLSCYSNPCKNGVCHDGLNGTYICKCADMYEGDHCEKKFVPRPSCTKQCEHNGTCIQINSTGDHLEERCKCIYPYTGANCEESVVATSSSCDFFNCTATEVCVSQNTSPACVSEERCPGGEDCEMSTKIQLLVKERCGRCTRDEYCRIDVNGDATCECLNNLTGCTPCRNIKCENHGVCMETGDGDYRCNCARGFGGRRCTNVDVCFNDWLSPCKNNATCKPNFDKPFQPHCICQPGYSGLHCQIADWCSDDVTCGKNGSCVSGEQGDVTCKCNPGFAGSKCDIRNEQEKVKCNHRHSPIHGYCGKSRCMGSGCLEDDVCKWQSPCQLLILHHKFDYLPDTCSHIELQINPSKLLRDMTVNEFCETLKRNYTAGSPKPMMFCDGSSDNNNSSVIIDLFLYADSAGLVGPSTNEYDFAFIELLHSNKKLNGMLAAVENVKLHIHGRGAHVAPPSENDSSVIGYIIGIVIIVGVSTTVAIGLYCHKKSINERSSYHRFDSLNGVRTRFFNKHDRDRRDDVISQEFTTVMFERGGESNDDVL